MSPEFRDMADNKDHLQWFIEWTYSPTDFFEEPRHIQQEHCELTIKEGKVEAKIDPEYGDPRPALREELDAKLTSLFMGAQLVVAKPFKLSLTSTYHERPGGGKDIFVELSDVIGVVDIQADIKIVDKDGNVVADTRAKERIRQTHFLADLAAKYGHTDEVAKKILQSHRNAMDDPNDLFVHLYEIRDALKIRFGGEKETKRVLRIPEEEWKDLGRLANAEPLTQGRHRGAKSGLRDATKQEIDRGVAAAQMMIENYLRYIDATL